MRILPLAACVAVLGAGLSGAAAAADFRAPRIAPQLIGLPAPEAKATTPAPESGRLKVGDVRALAKAARLAAWSPVEGGFVARLRADSATAQGLRVRLDLGAVPGAFEVRVQGSASPRIESMAVDPRQGNVAWTPWTEGSAQLIEVFSPVAPSESAVNVGAVLHFTASPTAKAAASCTLSTACTTGDFALDAQIEERKKSMARISFVSGGAGFVCTATLIDTPQRPAPYLLTANHCVGDALTAGTITAFWFYESTGCDNNTARPGFVQAAGGMQLVFANYMVDASLLLMNSAPPEGALYAPLSIGLVPDGTRVISLSHPTGDTSRWAEGINDGLGRANDIPYDMYVVTFSRGMIQGGSSGSGAFVRANGRLELAGVLSLGPLEESCSNARKFGVYSRLEVFHPQIAQYIGAASIPADDVPNRPADAVGLGTVPVDAQSLTRAARIDYAGDVDAFRFTLPARAAVTAYTQGSQDMVAAILDADGLGIEANDDSQVLDTNAGITRVLPPGTYHLQVGHWAPAGTGPYEVVVRADRVDANYTALWWNATESGWGINVNHQGNILFATLFTYDERGMPMWLVMSRGDRQADGSFSGVLHRTTGPAFNASPWGAIGTTEVGTMRLAFQNPDNGTLTYTYNGRPVTKAITRQLFGTAPDCGWSFFDRSYAQNVQDLWWNAAESGWGLNLTHQDETLFATLFTYAASGEGMWLVMPEGIRDTAGTWSGNLYRTRGPAFDASPWTPIQSFPAGTMSIAFTHGNAGTLTYTVDAVTVTKPIERQVFAAPRTKCES